MAIVVTERFNSRSDFQVALTAEGKSSGVLRYIITGSDDVGAMEAQLESTAPATFEGLPRTQAKVGQQLAVHIWEGEVQYGDPDSRENQSAGDSTFNFEIATEQLHILNSISTPDKAPAGAPDLKGAINFDGEKVHGVDILVPRYSFSETWVKAAADVDDSYKDALAGLVGKVNDDTFRGFAAGEVLFVGASGTLRPGTGDYEITFRFAVSKNQAALTIGGVGPVAKDGWDYVWCRYKTVEDADHLVKQVEAVYVEQVYEDGDFDGIEI